MPSETITLRGHIIDSLILPKVLDEILATSAQFEILDLKVGRRREETSQARIRVEAETEDILETVLKRLQLHGAELPDRGDAALVPSPADGVFPDRFYVSSSLPTLVRAGGNWLDVLPVRMDCGIAVDTATGSARTRKFWEVQAGELIVVGHDGVRVRAAQRAVDRSDTFEFMASGTSTEKPKSAVIRATAECMKDARSAGEPILLVAGPAVVHTGAGPHVVRLIELGYVQVLFAGNALAVHDIESALFGTALGVHLGDAAAIEKGHEHHIHAINTIRRIGCVRAAVQQGVLTTGIMHACVRHHVDMVLAGSIRDDGPLPEVITDMIEAQRAMAERAPRVGFALMVATMLHSIAAGNLLPASTRIVCVDINPSVVTKLTDRGSFQSVGIVTDVEPFLLELLTHLA